MFSRSPMVFSGFKRSFRLHPMNRPLWRRWMVTGLLICMVGLSGFFGFGTPSAWASLKDDHFDGNIFALYGGNGSLVPPKVTLTESFRRQKPVLLVFFVDDSSDSKQFTTVVSQLQAFYGRAADFMPINVDSIPVKSTYEPTEPGYYYQGFVPQTVLLDESGKIIFNEKGQVPFQKIDDVFRKLFNLLPRSESLEIKRRSVNEINSEFTTDN